MLLCWEETPSMRVISDMDVPSKCRQVLKVCEVQSVIFINSAGVSSKFVIFSLHEFSD